MAQSASPDRATLDEARWYQDAVIYQVHVRGFFDSNGDGVGDFPGLLSKLDYIQSLGVSAIWLQPFYPSPLRDDGYDVADYQGVHPQYGSTADVVAFMRAAHDRGLKVITELVINHTSDQHPWFQAARRAPRGSARRAFYVWSDTNERYGGAPIIFKDTERSNWTWDPIAGQYYWHRFFHHQPDLNFDHPAVLKAVLKVMRFWLDLGVDGMRLDAVPYLVEREGTSCANLPETHAILRTIRRELDARHRGRMLLAEANQWPSDVRAYFGDGDECHMAFHFPLMPRLFMALRQEDRHPLSEILYQTPDIPDGCQWAIFLRNHDELTLEMVSDDERDDMYRAYAADPEMRLNVGIRRRLAPLLENSRPRIELLTGLLLSLPGTPVLYYGDEIGMGDNVYLRDRNGVRTPMQWSADRNGGFSSADPARLYAPPIMDPVYGYASVNVEAQERSPHSLLAWTRRMIALRQRHATFGRGAMELLRPANRRIFAFIRRLAGEEPILVVANLSRTVQAVSLHLAAFAGRVPVELSGGVELPRVTDAPYPLTLGPHAFYWLRLQVEAPVDLSRQRTVPARPEPEVGPLLIGPEWARVFDTSVRQVLERRHLAAFLVRQPWFHATTSPIAGVQVIDWGILRPGDEPAFVTILEVTLVDGSVARDVVPLAFAAGSRADEIVQQTPGAVLATIGGARQGVLHARLDERLADALLQVLIAGRDVHLRHGRLHPQRLDGFAALALPERVEDLPRLPRDLERRHSCASFGEQVMLKVVRRLAPTSSAPPDPASRLARTPSQDRVAELLGRVMYEGVDGRRGIIAVCERFIPHQRSAWQQAVDDLRRFLESVTGQDAPTEVVSWSRLWGGNAPPDIAAQVGAFAHVARNVGQRLAELHRDLALTESEGQGTSSTLDATRAEACAARAEAIRDRAEAALTTVAQGAGEARVLATRCLAGQLRLKAAIRSAFANPPAGLSLTTAHGDLDLSNMLLFEGDVRFIGGASEAEMGDEAQPGRCGPIQDLTGVLQSIRHVAATTLAVHPATSAPERGRLEAWARWWTATVGVIVVQAYRASAGSAPFVPHDRADAWLWALSVERACADVVSSVARPAWLCVVLAELVEAMEDAPV